jgi:hypothetical protein
VQNVIIENRIIECKSKKEVLQRYRSQSGRVEQLQATPVRSKTGGRPSDARTECRMCPRRGRSKRRSGRVENGRRKVGQSDGAIGESARPVCQRHGIARFHGPARASAADLDGRLHGVE